MKGLLEKLKALDKKVWIIAGAAAVVVIAAVITLVIVLGGSGEDSPSGTETSTTTAVTTSSTSKGNTTTQKMTTTAKKATTTTSKKTIVTTTTVSSTDTVTTDATSADNGSAATNVPTVPSTSLASTAATSAATVATQPTATNPQGEEIFGAGSKDQPYLETPDLNTMTVKTVSIPAGKSLYYSIYRVGNMILTIENANAYVVCDGARYDAQNGIVSFKVPDALASDAVSFEIGNKGASAASFTIRFENEKGSQMNPVIIGKLSGENKVSLAEGASQGYYYKYNAEKSGKLRLYMTASVDSVMFATNNRNSAQRTTEADALTDAQGKIYIELDVQTGDEIIINVGAKPNKRGKYPATDITWSGKYS